MVSQDPAIRHTGLEWRSAIARQGTAAGIMAVRATVIAAFALALSTAAHAATITVSTLNDPAGSSGTCSLRDAITAANTMTAMNGCAAGTGNDTIQFSVSGTILLDTALPSLQITDNQLTITGPITIDGGGNLGLGVLGVQVMQIASGAALNFKNLEIADGGADNGGGILDKGTLTVIISAFSGKDVARQGGAVYNEGTLTVIESTVSGLGISFGGAIYNDGMLTVANSRLSGNAGAGGCVYNVGRFVDGIWNFSGGAIEVSGSIKNTILAGSTIFNGIG
jgi:CSLREA domain-containing protein